MFAIIGALFVIIGLAHVIPLLVGVAIWCICIAVQLAFPLVPWIRNNP